MMPTTMRIMPTMPAGFIGTRLQGTPALNQIDNQHHNGEHEQDLNKSAQRVGPDQSKHPKHEQDHKYSPEHSFLSVESYLCFASRPSIALIQLTNHDMPLSPHLHPLS